METKRIINGMAQKGEDYKIALHRVSIKTVNKHM